MADSFDAVEIMQDILGTSISGTSVFKERSTRNYAGDHVVIRSTACNKLDVVNVAIVNVNIYVQRWKDGTVNRQELKTMRSAIATLIANDTGPAGYYCVIDEVFSALLEEVKEGFDCFTTRYEITLNK